MGAVGVGVTVGVSTRGVSTVLVVVGTTVGGDCGTVGVWVCTGGGAGTGGGGEGGTGGACGVGVAAEPCCRSPGP